MSAGSDFIRPLNKVEDINKIRNTPVNLKVYPAYTIRNDVL